MTSNSDVPELSLRTLSYLLIVIEEGSFTAAARRLGISQPALSHQIRSLEDTLGGPVLERFSHGVRPTDAGKALIPEAEGAIACALRAARATRAALTGNPIGLEISTFPSLATGMLLSPISLWHSRFPGAVLRLSEFRHRGRLEQSVAHGTGDIAFGSLPTNWEGSKRLVGRESFRAVLPPNDPLLAKSGPIQLELLATRPWILLEPDYGLADLVTSACDHLGFSPNGIIETSQAEAAARLAGAGLGVTLVPSRNLPMEVRSQSRPTSPAFVWDIWAYSRADWPPQALRFLEILAETHPLTPQIPNSIRIGPRVLQHESR